MWIHASPYGLTRLRRLSRVATNNKTVQQAKQRVASSVDSKKPAGNGRPTRNRKAKSQMGGSSPSNSSGTQNFLGLQARRYARLLADPVNEEPVGIPTSPVLFSSTQHCWAKGSFSTGTAGVGFVVASPLSGASSTHTAGSVQFSQATYTGTQIVAQSPAPANVGFANTNSPYAGTDFSVSGAQFRVVAAALRIRYSGALLNMGGQVVGLHHPAHANLNGADFVSMNAYDEASLVPADNERWATVIYRVVDADDIDFTTASPNIAANPNSAYMGFIAVAPPTVTLQFTWEFHVVYEFMGQIVRNKKVSGADPVGFEAVQHSAAILHKKPFMSDHGSREAADHTEKVANAVGQHATSHPGPKSTQPTDVLGKIISTAGTIFNGVENVLSWL